MNIKNQPESLCLSDVLIPFEFSEALKSQARPRIEDFAAKATAEGQVKVLIELIRSDILWNLRNGEPIPVSVYRERFPNQSEIIDAAFDLVKKHLGIPTGSRFILKKFIGHGTYGQVYLATDINLGRSVAFKVPTSDEHQLPDPFRRMVLEASKQVAFEHKNVVRVYDADIAPDNSGAYIAMEFVDGAPLADRIRRSSIRRKAAAIVMQIADALHAAHCKGLVHGDLKPGNILMDRSGQPHVTDFGFARRLFQVDPPLAVSGDVRSGELPETISDRFLGGTKEYMSPEQWTTRTVDPQSDIWSLGVILYELLAGHRPFQEGATSIESQVTVDAFVPPFVPRTVPRTLDRICRKCLAQQKEDRYASAARLSGDLRWWLGRRRRIWITAIVSAATMISIVAVAAAWQWQGYRKRLAEDAAFVQRNSEEGRQLLVSDNARQALPALQNAYSKATERGAAGPPLRFLLRRAQGALGPIPRTFGSKGDAIRQCQVDRDGKLLAGIAANDRIVIVDVASGQIYFRSDSQGASLSYVGFNHDGSRLLSVAGTRATVWDVSRKKPFFECIGHDMDVKWAAFSPDGQRVVTASVDNTARIWNGDGSPALVLEGHTKSVVYCDFDPRGDRVVTTSIDGSARVWDAHSGTQLKLFRPSKAPMESAVFSPDGRLLVTESGNGDGLIRIWDIQTGSLTLSTDRGGRFGRPAFYGDGARCLIATARDGGKTVEVWDVFSQKAVATLAGHQSMVANAEISRDGTLLATGGFDKTARIWDLASQREILRTDDPGAGAFETAHFANDGSHLLTNGNRGTWTLHDLTGGALLDTLQGQALASSSTQMILKDGSNRVGLSPVLGNQASRVFPIGDGTTCAAISRDGKRFALGRASSNEIVIGDTASLACNSVRMDMAGVESLRFDSLGQQLIAVAIKDYSKPRTVQLIDMSRQRPVHTTSVNALVVLATGFDSEAMRPLAAVNGTPDMRSPNTIEIRDAADGSLIRTISSPSLMSTSGAFSADGKRLAVCNADGGASVWDMTNGSMICSVTGHGSSFVNSADFSPDGTLLATGGNDRSVKIWDVASGKTLITFAAHTAPVSQVIWTSDGGTLVASCADRTTRLWDVRY